MAKIDSDVKPPFIGTVGILCIYEMHGRYYMRVKSSLTGKRVKKTPAFRRTMENAGFLATASKMASGVYRQLPRQQKKHALYRQLTGRAFQLLREGINNDVIITELLKMCQPPVVVKPVRKPIALRRQLAALWRYGNKEIYARRRKRRLLSIQEAGQSISTGLTILSFWFKNISTGYSSLCFF
ncbi:MAG TPA: hypothetical protein VM802_05750 [Chitinophaga sp.]|uniref:hypothetical protein n=1 Tax=Chitinophaga sp. TaxID=1869181 RepID=UPI002C6F2385|nr:hypothetical protein [Chitinophaga sp.]HVI44349.1 hypothetical protein [Chitinophaga sp.]